MSTSNRLQDDISAAFTRACQERDWEVAEFLFQALEAIAGRDSDEVRLNRACGELVQNFQVPRC